MNLLESERVLVIEEDVKLRRILTDILIETGLQVGECGSGPDGLALLQREPFDAVILSLSLAGSSGTALLGKISAEHPHLPVVAFSKSGGVEEAVSAMRAGAFDFLVTPFGADALIDAARKALDQTRQRRLKQRQRAARRQQVDGLIGRSRPIRELRQLIDQVAGSRAPVLITGETGTGKELVARAIHQASGLSPFVPLNCGALPEKLIESELFGYARGAFTDASRDKPGLIETADGGTLFLDEVGELPLALQPKLLRVLQEGEIRRVGETMERKVRVRIISATHHDLRERVAAGQFREDLVFRLNVLPVHVPALRERATDIPLLAVHFLAQIAEREGKGEMHFSPKALALLIAYSWPGNVRQLINLVERTAILAESQTIGTGDLPRSIRDGTIVAGSRANWFDLALDRSLSLAEVEREYTVAALRRTGGNKSLAARLLQLPRRTLYRRLDDLGFTHRQPEPDD